MQPWQFEQHFSDNGLERLAYMGDFELEISHEYQHTEAYYPGGEYESALEGRPQGIARCNLKFKVLPDSQAQSIALAPGGEQTLAMYIFEFFRRHNSPAKKSFICPHPLTEVDTKWRFVESKISMANVAARLWGAGYALVEHVDDVNITDTSQNPNTI